MKDKAWFNVVFMLICTAILTGILSGVYVYSRPLIQANTRLREIKAQLYALNIEVPADMSSTELAAYYEQIIEEKNVNGLTAYEYKTDDGRTQYAFPFEGAALWGDISGIIALDQDLKTVLGLDFISQNETPGLGGRIEEDWFKEQFRGISLYEEGDPVRYATVSDEGQIDAITGATSTSNAVLGLINETIKDIKSKMGGGN
jgi:Na+-transporting NADH:ubiquinone oxidoreductase subunit C